MEIIKNYNLDTFILDENGMIFDNFVKSNFNMEEHGINLKYYHTLRVAKMSKEVGKKVGLDENLCYLLGLLHDYARFYQWAEFKSFLDRKTFDHADRACHLLFEEGKIADFKVDKKDYLLLNMAIKFHNKFAIDEQYIKDQFSKDADNTNSFETIINYCNLIRDTDKLDLFNLIGFGGLSIMFEKDGYTTSCLESLKAHQLVKIEQMQTKLDRIFCFLAFLFDLNFKASLAEINLENYFSALREHYAVKLNEEDKNFLNEVILEVKAALKA